MFYYGQRNWVFNVPARVDVDRLVEFTIDAFVESAKVLVPRLVLTRPGGKRRRRAPT